MARARSATSKAFLLPFVALVVAGTAVPVDAAGWKFQSLGKTEFASNPSCAHYSDASNSSAVCAALSSSGHLEFNFRDGSTGKFGGWKSLAGETVAKFDPNCASAGTEGVICAAVASNGGLLLYQYSGGALTSQLTLTQAGLPILASPGCTWLEDNQVGCVSRTGGGELFVAQFNGTAWGAADWSTSIVAESTLIPFSSVSCAPDNQGNGWCAYLTSDSNVLAVEMAPNQGGLTWSTNLQGTATTPPTCASATVDGKVACFAAGTSSGLYVNTFNSSSNTSWIGLNGEIHGASCTEFGGTSGQYVCGVTGVTDDGFWVDVYNGTSWSGWSEPGTVGEPYYVGTPSCIALSTAPKSESVLCVTQRVDGTMEAAINSSL